MRPSPGPARHCSAPDAAVGPWQVVVGDAGAAMAGGKAAGGAEGEGEAAGGRRDRAWFAARGFPGGPVGYAHAGFCALNSFSWIAPLLALGARGGVGEATAEAFVSEDFEAPVLAARFDAAYAELTVRSPTERLECSSQSLKWPGTLAGPPLKAAVEQSTSAEPQVSC